MEEAFCDVDKIPWGPSRMEILLQLIPSLQRSVLEKLRDLAHAQESESDRSKLLTRIACRFLVLGSIDDAFAVVGVIENEAFHV